MHRRHVVILPLCIAVGWPARAAAASDDERVTPGVRIGSFALTMSVEEMEQSHGPLRAIGPPEGQPQFLAARLQQDQAREFWIHRWDHLGVRASTEHKSGGQVLTINAASAVAAALKFRTVEGITNGASREEVTRVYGRPTAITIASEARVHLIFDEAGIAFRIHAIPDKVENILVFLPGTGRARWKF